MSPKAGRPTDNPKGKHLAIRLTEEEKDLLDKCAKELGVSNSEVVRMGIKAVHEGLKKK